MDGERAVGVVVERVAEDPQRGGRRRAERVPLDGLEGPRSQPRAQRRVARELRQHGDGARLVLRGHEPRVDAVDGVVLGAGVGRHDGDAARGHGLEPGAPEGLPVAHVQEHVRAREERGDLVLVERAEVVPPVGLGRAGVEAQLAERVRREERVELRRDAAEGERRDGAPEAPAESLEHAHGAAGVAARRGRADHGDEHDDGVGVGARRLRPRRVEALERDRAADGRDARPVRLADPPPQPLRLGEAQHPRVQSVRFAGAPTLVRRHSRKFDLVVLDEVGREEVRVARGDEVDRLDGGEERRDDDVERRRPLVERVRELLRPQHRVAVGQDERRRARRLRKGAVEVRHQPAGHGHLRARASIPEAQRLVDDGNPAAVHLELVFPVFLLRVEDEKDPQPPRAAGAPGQRRADAPTRLRELLVGLEEPDGVAEHRAPPLAHGLGGPGAQRLPRRVAVGLGLVVPDVDVVGDFERVARRERAQRKVVLLAEAVGKRDLVHEPDRLDDLGLDEQAEPVQHGHVDEPPPRSARDGRRDAPRRPRVVGGPRRQLVLRPVLGFFSSLHAQFRHGLVRRGVRQRADDADRWIRERVALERLEPARVDDLHVAVQEAERGVGRLAERGPDPEVRGARVAVESMPAVPVDQAHREAPGPAPRLDNLAQPPKGLGARRVVHEEDGVARVGQRAARRGVRVGPERGKRPLDPLGRVVDGNDDGDLLRRGERLGGGRRDARVGLDVRVEGRVGRRRRGAGLEVTDVQISQVRERSASPFERARSLAHVQGRVAELASFKVAAAHGDAGDPRVAPRPRNLRTADVGVVALRGREPRAIL